MSQRLQGSPVANAVGNLAGHAALHISTHTLPEELRTLYALASNCPAGAAALEIGSYVGASTCYIAAGLASGGGHLFCVDTWQNETMPEGARDTFREFQTNTRRVAHLLTMLRKPSSELSAADVRTPLSLVFIDGDHSYEAARADYQKIREWVAIGGVVAFHDFSRHFPGVPRAVGEALAEGNWVVGGCVHTLIWMFRAS
jgi:predicted O-methyltransferase YrrM